MIITGGTLNGGVYLDQQQVVTQGLTMWLDAGNPTSYPGSGTTWFDLSGFGANITLQNSPAWIGGTPAYFTFNGANQYGVGSTANVLPNNQYTKSMWLRLNSYSYNNNVVSSFTGGHFTFGSGTNHFYSGHQDWANYNAFPTAATFDLGRWYYIAVTFEAYVSMKTYVNGVFDASSSYNLNPHPGDGSTDIASYDHGNFLSGSIGEFFCYNRSLTDLEVLQNYNSTKGKYGL
jgi:hypothetical protein